MTTTKLSKFYKFDTSEKMSMCIYKITNIINGKCYIGQTQQKARKRWIHHLHYAKTVDTNFSRAILKYGVGGFKFEVIN